MLADAIVAALVAPACPVCGELLDHPTRGAVCGGCWAAIRPLTFPLCAACGDPLPAGRLAEIAQLAAALASVRSRQGASEAPDPACPDRCPRCRRGASLISRSRAVGEYAGALRQIVHVFKYEKRRSVAHRLGPLMRDAGADVLRDAHVAVPVPLHWRRRWQRGFNQASLLASHLGIPVWTPLARVRATSPQVALAAAARRANMRDAFALAHRQLPWHPSWAARLDGKIVVLVDDVATTGATLEACARVLREAGAGEVRALTAARVVGLRL